MRDFLQRRLVRPILALLTSGITPEKIALSVVFGVALGVFPVLGSTTLLCALAAVVFRLNLPAIQLVNYFVYPVQLLLLLPFMRLGAAIFGGTPVRLSLTQMLAMFRADSYHALGALWVAAVQAVGAWSLLTPPLGVLVYIALLWFLKRVAVRMELARSTGSPTHA